MTCPEVLKTHLIILVLVKNNLQLSGHLCFLENISNIVDCSVQFFWLYVYIFIQELSIFLSALGHFID